MSPSLILGAGACLVVSAMLVWVVIHRRRERRDRATASASIGSNLHLPPSLHPVIDPDVCIGSLSCIKACPEGDILGIVDGVARLIVGANCIGHGRCATECPVDAIKLVFGTAERGVDLPEVDGNFETSVAGVHVVGELGGMGLIKNALTQGLQVAAYLGRSIARAPATEGMVDVLVVGAGPAGLAAALGCREAGLSCRVVEQSSVGGTVAHYPRQKIVMTERIDLPLIGRFGKSVISKEELLAGLQRIVAHARIAVSEGVKVTGLQGGDGAFTVLTQGEPVRARKVVLATGRRGSPRPLGVPGEELSKVTYQLVDPEQYGSARTLVVGGGDSAVEAAIALAEKSTGEVTIAHRGEAFARCREKNRKRIAELVESGRVRALMGASVTAVTADRVALAGPGDTVNEIDNDFVIACLGGELPVEFLRSVGVDMKRHHGTRGEKAPVVKITPAHRVERARPRREGRGLAIALFLVGAAIVAGLSFAGWGYYLLPRAARLRSPMHLAFRPAGVWGHGVGIVATGVMMLNFLYAVRKRWDRLRRAGSIRLWLTWHIFVGFMSPVVILFHAAFQSNNLVATSTYLSLLIVVGTGIIGRYIYGLAPSASGKTTELSVLRAQLERERQHLQQLVASGYPYVNDERVRDHHIEALIEQAGAPAPEHGSLVAYLFKAPFIALAHRLTLARAKHLFPDADRYVTLRQLVSDLGRLRAQVAFYRGLKRLLSGWRMFHVILAVLLVGIIAVHVALSVFLGYRWIFG